MNSNNNIINDNIIILIIIIWPLFFPISLLNYKNICFTMCVLSN